MRCGDASVANELFPVHGLRHGATKTFSHRLDGMDGGVAENPAAHIDCSVENAY